MALTEEQFGTIFTKVAEGKSLSSALRDERSSFGVFYNELDVNEPLRERYARARIHQAEASQCKIMDAAQDCLDGLVEPNAARVAIDALKWNAARLHPAIYGDSLKQEITGRGGAPLTIGWLREGA